MKLHVHSVFSMSFKNIAVVLGRILVNSQLNIINDTKTEEVINMKSLESVKAFFLLKAANMSELLEKLARATATFEYREKIIKIFGELGLHETSGGAPIVKEEVLHGQSFRTNDRGSSICTW